MGEHLSYDNKGNFVIGGESSSDYTIQKTEKGTKIVLKIGSDTCTIEWGADNRYLIVNGTDLYVYSDMAKRYGRQNSLV